ncbi:uncharacterized protein [Amphiura filiformis]|uniref:uncharacterized protein n=1 Tax=Amphiura filiformis TaxID=82378 RepID=UPI003B210AA6
MPLCRVYGCDVQSGKGITLHRFPYLTDLERARHWLVLCKIEVGDIRKYNFKNRVICGRHFADDAYKNDMQSRLLHEQYPDRYDGRPRKILKPDAMPTLFLPGHDQPKERLSSINRQRRNERKRLLAEATGPISGDDSDLTKDQSLPKKTSSHRHHGKLPASASNHHSPSHSHDGESSSSSLHDQQPSPIHAVDIDATSSVQSFASVSAVEVELYTVKATPGRATMKNLNTFRCLYCHRYFHDWDYFQRHKQRHKSVFPKGALSLNKKQKHPKQVETSKHICSYCPVSLDDEHSLQIHLNSEHYCMFCQFHLPSDELKSHMNEHHRCKFCQNLFRISSLRNHILSEHKCKCCKLHVDTWIPNMPIHFASKHKQRYDYAYNARQCSTCKMVFSTKCTRNLHHVKWHNADFKHTKIATLK